MADKVQLALLSYGVEVWNAWRKANPLVKIDLREANLQEADLRRADLQRANLESAHLEHAYLSDANLQAANLRGARAPGTKLYGTNLQGADLQATDLSFVDIQGTNLQGANLQGAELHHARIQRVDLQEANLFGSVFNKTIVIDTDLSTVYGLDNVQHRGPSTIGIDTLYRSKGKIPESFLRGCGVPEPQIEYLPALIAAMQPIQYHSCFISYSTKDEAFAQRLHERMRAASLRVWYAPEEMKGGHKIHEQIDQAIQRYDRLLVVLSDASLQSEWVKTEIRKAWRTEQREGRRKLFPIRLTEMPRLEAWEWYDGGRDLAQELREYFIPDFSSWKDHDAFEAAFARLYNDLKASTKPRATPSNRR